MTVAVETAAAGCHLDVTPAALERLVHQATDENPYLIVTREDREGFAQAHLVPSKRDGRRRFLVEYREGPEAPMRSTELVIDRAVGVLTGWAFDHPHFADGIRWHTEKLESMVDLRGQCEFADAPAGGRTCRLSGTPAERAPGAPELAVVWAVVGEGTTDDAAFNEFVTRMAELVNRADSDVRVAWGTWLGQWIVKVPREEVARRRSQLDEDQQRRVRASSKRHWPEELPEQH